MLAIRADEIRDEDTHLDEMPQVRNEPSNEGLTFPMTIAAMKTSKVSFSGVDAESAYSIAIFFLW